MLNSFAWIGSDRDHLRLSGILHETQDWRLSLRRHGRAFG